MAERRVVVVVRTGATRRRLRSILRWVRALVPAAGLAVAAPGVPPPLDEDEEPLVLDLDDASGPLAIAEALLRARRGEKPDRAGPA